jgi:hypothetical protein
MKNDGFDDFRKSKIYLDAFQSASSYVRKVRKYNLLYYLISLGQITELAHETMVFLIAFTHLYDNLTDEPGLTSSQKDEMHSNIYKMALSFNTNSFELNQSDSNMKKWLYFLIKIDKECGLDNFKYLKLLYESNIEDYNRRGKIYIQ